MPDGMTFSENIQNEKRKWKNMNGKQRWDYFKTYYLFKTIIVLAALVAVISFVLQVTVFSKDVVLSGFVFNLYLDEMDSDSFQEDFLKFIDGNPKEEDIVFNSQTINDTDTNGMMMVAAHVSANDLDFMIMDQSAYDIFSLQGMFGNVKDFISTDEFARYSDAGKIVTAVWPDTEDEYDAAIDISECKYAKEHWPGQKVYLAYIVNSQNTDELTVLLKYLEK